MENGCLNRSYKTPLKCFMQQRWMLKNQEENRLQITATLMWSPQTLTDERCCQREQWARWTTDMMHFFTFLMSIKASPFASTTEEWSLLFLKVQLKIQITRLASLPVPDISQTTFIMSFVASEGWLFPGLEKALTVSQKIKWSQIKIRHFSCMEQFRKIHKSEKKTHLLARKHSQYSHPYRDPK